MWWNGWSQKLRTNILDISTPPVNNNHSYALRAHFQATPSSNSAHFMHLFTMFRWIFNWILSYFVPEHRYAHARPWKYGFNARNDGFSTGMVFCLDFFKKKKKHSMLTTESLWFLQKKNLFFLSGIFSFACLIMQLTFRHLIDRFTIFAHLIRTVFFLFLKRFLHVPSFCRQIRLFLQPFFTSVSQYLFAKLISYRAKLFSMPKAWPKIY